MALCNCEIEALKKDLCKVVGKGDRELFLSLAYVIRNNVSIDFEGLFKDYFKYYKDAIEEVASLITLKEANDALKDCPCVIFEINQFDNVIKEKGITGSEVLRSKEINRIELTDEYFIVEVWCHEGVDETYIETYKTLKDVILDLDYDDVFNKTFHIEEKAHEIATNIIKRNIINGNYVKERGEKYDL